MCIGWLAESSESRSVIDPVDRINLTPLDVRIHSHGWIIPIFFVTFQLSLHPDIGSKTGPQLMKKLIGQTMAHWFCVCMTFSRKTASEDRFRQSYLIYLGLYLSSILISGPPIWSPQIDWLPRRLATNSRLADRQKFRFPPFSPFFSFSSPLHG